MTTSLKDKVLVPKGTVQSGSVCLRLQAQKCPPSAVPYSSSALACSNELATTAAEEGIGRPRTDSCLI